MLDTTTGEVLLGVQFEEVRVKFVPTSSRKAVQMSEECSTV